MQMQVLTHIDVKYFAYTRFNFTMTGVYTNELCGNDPDNTTTNTNQ